MICGLRVLALVDRQHLTEEMDVRGCEPGPDTPIDGSIWATPSMPLSSFSSLNAISVVPSSDVPSGVSMWIVHSPMSSFGTNSRPTMRLSGNSASAATTEMPMIDAG